MDFSFRFGANVSGGNSSIETAGSLACGVQDVETMGSLACLSNGGGFDSFGSKDVFGDVDFSNADMNFFASVPQVETMGSLACADFGGMSLGAGVGADFGGAPCASVGADLGASCGSGAFSSVC